MAANGGIYFLPASSHAQMVAGGRQTVTYGTRRFQACFIV
jgi:hypothetical protein